MSEIKQRGFWKRNGVYFVGAGLAYTGAFGINFIGGNSSLEARTAWALGWGILMWPFYLVPQLLIQWIVSGLLPSFLTPCISGDCLLFRWPRPVRRCFPEATCITAEQGITYRCFRC